MHTTGMMEPQHGSMRLQQSSHTKRHTLMMKATQCNHGKFAEQSLMANFTSTTLSTLQLYQSLADGRLTVSTSRQVSRSGVL